MAQTDLRPGTTLTMLTHARGGTAAYPLLSTWMGVPERGSTSLTVEGGDAPAPALARKAKPRSPCAYGPPAMPWG